MIRKLGKIYLQYEYRYREKLSIKWEWIQRKNMNKMEMDKEKHIHKIGMYSGENYLIKRNEYKENPSNNGDGYRGNRYKMGMDIRDNYP